MLPVERCGRRADVATSGEGHADVAGEARGDAAEDEGHRAEQAGLPQKLSAIDSSGLMISVDVKNTISGERDEDHGDRAELALEVGEAPSWMARAISRIFGVPSSCGEDRSGEEDADAEGEQRRGDREPQDGPLAALQYEVLPATFGSEQRKIHDFSRFRAQPRCRAQRAAMGGADNTGRGPGPDNPVRVRREPSECGDDPVRGVRHYDRQTLGRASVLGVELLELAVGGLGVPAQHDDHDERPGRWPAAPSRCRGTSRRSSSVPITSRPPMPPSRAAAVINPAARPRLPVGNSSVR